MRDGEGNPNSGQMLVFVPPHPLIKHWLAIARNEATPPQVFRSALSELGRLLIYEAVRDWLPTLQGQIQTPLGIADVEVVDPSQPIKVIPILRAGLVLLEQANTVMPIQETYHVGVERNEETLQPRLYLSKLPARFEPDARVLVSDPMLATGGTIGLVLDELIKRGADVKLMRVIGIVAAPPALKLLSERYPGLRVFVAMIDENLDDKGRIVPGLGDAGDRAFGNT